MIPSSSSSAEQSIFSSVPRASTKKDDNSCQPQISQKRTLLKSQLNPEENYCK